ncbi:hypothetical protein PUR22_00465 [Mycolicibacterium porcinum]|uniref:hypothetical protein n=1 Tax=Mycolicibacterium porcinum TaxID=39693 RepID=UPI0031FA0C88
MASDRGGLGRGVAGAVAALSLVLVSGACTTPEPESGPVRTTLTGAPADTGRCAADRLVRCVPGLADIDGAPFDEVSVYTPMSDFGWMPPGSARDAAPEGCRKLPQFGADGGAELDVTYRAATGTPGFATSEASVDVRFTAADDNVDVPGEMSAWAGRCPMWGIAPTMTDGPIHGWMVAESAEKLSRYRSGDTANQWPFVTHTAVTQLPNGVIVQAWYRTDEPSETSRAQRLSQLLAAAGRPRPRATLPAQLDEWNAAGISTLLPPLAGDSAVTARTEPGSVGSICSDGHRDQTARYDTLATWHSFDQSKWDEGKPLRPTVTIGRARPGVDYLAALRREIATCTARLDQKPAVCGDRENRTFIDADSAVADGQEVLRYTRRWMGEAEVRGGRMCSEGVEAMRAAQIGPLVILAGAGQGGYLFRGDAPPLPTDTLDQLLAVTVQRIKDA